MTDAVLDEVRDWQSRALERMYPIVIFDALRVKIRDADSRLVKNKAVYVALGVTRDGVREVLGLWIAENEGAKFWLSVMNELKNRGVQDVLIAVVDGLKGFPEAICKASTSLSGADNHAGRFWPLRSGRLVGVFLLYVVAGFGFEVVAGGCRSSVSLC